MVDVENIENETLSDYEDQGYLWMCTFCTSKPTFETINELFKHKESHQTNGCSEKEESQNEIAEDKNRELLQVSPDIVEIDVDNLEPPVSPSTSEDIPLANIAQKLNSINNKNKLTTNTKKLSKSFRRKSKVQKAINDISNHDNTKEDNEKLDSEVFEDDINDDETNSNSKRVNNICKICFMKFELRSELSKHKKTHLFENTKCYKCETCGKLCPKYDNFTRHLTIHNENRVKNYQCEICLTKFYNLADLKRHGILHVEIKPFKCKECGEGFTRHDKLLIHEYKHTGVRCKKFTCKTCFKVLNSPSALVMHSKTHLEKTVFCREDGCTFACYLQSQLRQHIRKHSGEKPFQCSICGRCFSRGNDMKNHISNVHERRRPYKCTLCPKKFALISNMRIHMVTHTNERPYLCAQCGKCFNHPSTLRKHTLILHNPWRSVKPGKTKHSSFHFEIQIDDETKIKRKTYENKIKRRKVNKEERILCDDVKTPHILLQVTQEVQTDLKLMNHPTIPPYSLTDLRNQNNSFTTDNFELQDTQIVPPVNLKTS